MQLSVFRPSRGEETGSVTPCPWFPAVIQRVRPFCTAAARRAVLSLVTLYVLCGPVCVHAQQTPKTPGSAGPDKRFDVFLGYSYLGGSVTGSLPDQPYGNQYFWGNLEGLNMNASWYFKRNIGMQFEAKAFAQLFNVFDDELKSVSVGPVFRFPPFHGLTPFFHVLGGAADVTGPYTTTFDRQAPEAWGPQLTVGEGLDYDLPLFHHLFAVRIVQADYIYDYVVFSAATSSNLNSASFSTGLVAHLGGDVQPALKLACSPSPQVVSAGAPVMIGALPSGLDRKKPATYRWASPDLPLSGSGPTVSVDTAGLRPGKYAVIVQVSQGPKARQSAHCATSFVVQEVTAQP